MDLNMWERELLRVIRDTAPRAYRKMVRKAGNLLRKYVRRLTPRVSGELRKSYRVKMRGKDTVIVYSNKFYAKMVEEGHVGPNGHGFIEGKHYLRKALEQTEEELPELLKEFVHRVGRELGMNVR